MSIKRADQYLRYAQAQRGNIDDALAKIDSHIAVARAELAEAEEPPVVVEPPVEPPPVEPPDPVEPPGMDLIRRMTFLDAAGDELWSLDRGAPNYRVDPAGYGEATFRPALPAGSAPMQLSTDFEGRDEILISIDHETSPNFESRTGSHIRKIYFAEAGTTNPFILAVTGTGNQLSIVTQSTAAPGGAQRINGPVLQPGTRHRIDVLLRMNTVGPDGAAVADGIVVVSVDGDEMIRSEAMLYRGKESVKVGPTAKWTGFRWNPTWPGNGDSPTEEMWERMHDIAIYESEPEVTAPEEPEPPTEEPEEPGEPPVIIVPPAADMIVLEDWSEYQDIEEYRAANVSPHEGRYRTAGKFPENWSFGPPMPGSGARHSLIYTLPDRTGLRTDYSIGRDLYFPAPRGDVAHETEVWVEAWVRFDADWWCERAPDDWVGDLLSWGMKTLFINCNPRGRVQIKSGTFGHWRGNGQLDPPGDYRYDLYETIRPFYPDRGRWIKLQMWAKIHGDGTMSEDLRVEGQSIYKRDRHATTATSMWGLKLGANIHPGPDHEQSYAWGLVRVGRGAPVW